MGNLTYLGHLQVTEFAPEVLNGVQSDESCDEESNPLDTAYTTNRNSGKHQPQTPLRREWIMLLAVELGPAEDGSEGEA